MAALMVGGRSRRIATASFVQAGPQSIIILGS